ncbi:MAG: MFS transporter [Salinivenus sp.]
MSSPVQGIWENKAQFILQILTVFAVGLTMGAERNVVPLMGEEIFGVTSFLVIGSFVVSFGIVKAVLNLYSGKWADAYGRRPVLIAGWVSALPIPFLLIYAPSWGWVAVGNVLLGVNQGVAWSMSMISKIELAGPEQRGLAAGIDEAFGYTGVAVGAWLTGVIAAEYSLRPEPFYFLGAVIVLALLLAVFWIEETLPYAQAEAARGTDADRDDGELPFWEIVKRATYEDRTLFAAAQAGHVENFVDTLVWIAVPLFLAAQGLGPAEIGVVVGVHSGAYFLQVYTGQLGDQVGRKPPIVAGFALAGAGVLGMVLVDSYALWILFSGLSGVGMALHYPNLISVASDAAHPLWRSTGLGVYRMWRDLGYAVGAILIGLTVDLFSIQAAFYGVAGAMFVSGAYVLWRMDETHPRFGTHASVAKTRQPGSEVE